jgi:hypothetical protein
VQIIYCRCPSPPPPPNASNHSPLNHFKMARNLNPGQCRMIVHMINSKKILTTSQMAKLANCTERSITNIRKKMRLFGSPNPATIPPGPPPIVTSLMLDWIVPFQVGNTSRTKSGDDVSSPSTSSEHIIRIWSRSTGIPTSTLWRRANNKPSVADKAADVRSLYPLICIFLPLVN